MQRSLATAVVTAALLGGPAMAQPMSHEQLVATIQALQARVEALEARSRRDQAELRAMKSGTRRVVREPVPVAYTAAPATVVVAPPAPVPGNGFDGLYGAVIGGYQFGTTKAVENFTYSYPDVTAASGGSVGAAFGYNATSGSVLIGGELCFRKLFDETKVYTFSPFIINAQAPVVERYAREHGGDISIRSGFIWGDNLIYGRIGGGADALRHVYSARIFVPFGASVLLTKRETTASPYALIGIGVERNFGPWFARIEGAFLNHFEIRPTDYGRDSYFTTEISSAIGYRF